MDKNDKAHNRKIQSHQTRNPKLVTEIDKDAKENFLTRSQQINMILTGYGIGITAY